jgi:hypothetical protein
MRIVNNGIVYNHSPDTWQRTQCRQQREAFVNQQPPHCNLYQTMWGRNKMDKKTKKWNYLISISLLIDNDYGKNIRVV